MRRAWVQMGDFWHSKTHFKLKRLMFMGRIVGAGMSGAETHIWTKADTSAMNGVTVGMLRSMLRGRACDKTLEKHPESRSNAEILKHGRLAPCQREVVVRPIKWIQSTVPHQVEHGQTIAALTGRMALEKEDTLDEEGDSPTLRTTMRKRSLATCSTSRRSRRSKNFTKVGRRRTSPLHFC